MRRRTKLAIHCISYSAHLELGTNSAQSAPKEDEAAQDVTPQINELKKAGCQRIFQDKISGVKAERPGLEEVMDSLREGDSLVVWRLDRFTRSLKHLPETNRIQSLAVMIA